MNSFVLHNRLNAEITVVSNQFIDDYMVDADGEFVKIYLYLLRSSGRDDLVLSISSIADIFEYTEKDVLRALKYWEKLNLLHLVYESTGKIAGIELLPIERKVPTVATIQEEISSTIVSDLSLEDPSTLVQTMMPPPSPSIPDSLSEKELQMSGDRVKELSSQDEIKQLLFVTEQYLGKTLSVTESKTILYFHDTLHFSPDLIEFLVEYCVSKGSRSIHYIQSVALRWAKEGITTIKQAKESTSLYNKDYFAILKAFGIKGRNPVKTEVTFMNSWTKEYSFTLDIIEEACNRTVAQTHQPSFQYADRILTDWFKKGVHHLSDVTALDTKHKEKKAAKKENTPPPKQSSSPNKFNNFNSRDLNFQNLEQQLLKRR